jgi:hypothetical protein
MRPRNNFGNDSGKRALKGAAQGFVARAFSGVVAMWPTDSRDWALAMQAELGEIESSRESLRWLAGGLMSLIKAWWNEVMYGWKDGETEPSRVKTPGPLALAVAVAALVAFLVIPSANEGFRAVVRSWRPFTNTHAVDYQRMAREAETNRDAKTLVFIASRSRMDHTEEDARLADEAVAIDPSLTWIYSRGASGWYLYYQVTQKHGWIQKLEAFDPNNATPYLMEASVREHEIWLQSNYSLSNEKVLNDPVWRAAMEKAFAAPNYDSYYDRSIELQQSVLKAHNLRAPEEVAASLNGFYPFGLWGAGTYSKLLLRQAKDAKQKGDTAAAIHLAWSAAHFAERVRENSHGEMMRATADSILQPAYAFLQPLEASADHADVAKLLSIENEAFARKQVEKNIGRTEYYLRPLDATSGALHSAGIGVVVFGSVLILSALFLLLGRFAPGIRARWIYRWACNCGRFAPVCLAASIGLIAVTFAPYLDTVQDFFSGVRDAATLRELTSMGLHPLPCPLL